MKSKRCERCGAEFTPTGGQRFCAACREAHEKEHRREYYKNLPPEKKEARLEAAKEWQKRRRAERGETEAQKQWRAKYYRATVRKKNHAENEIRDSSTEARIREITAYYLVLTVEPYFHDDGTFSLWYETGENREAYPAGSVGAASGLNAVTAPLPDDTAEIVKLLRQDFPVKS